MEPYYDPIWGQLDALENSIERSMDPGLVFYPNPDQYIDVLGHELGALEASMDGAVIPPLKIAGPELPVLTPQTPQPRIPAPVSDGPPLLPEPMERYWTEMEPPLAARPYYSPAGLSRQPYRPHGRGGTGIRHDSNRTALINWCAEVNQYVHEEYCHSCDQWDDHGSGYEQCYHQWAEEEKGNPNDLEEKKEE